MDVVQDFALDECLNVARPREFEVLMTTKYDQQDQQARLFFISRAMRDRWADEQVAGRRVWVPRLIGVKEEGKNSLVITGPLFARVEDAKLDATAEVVVTAVEAQYGRVSPWVEGAGAKRYRLMR
eukprot:1174087-Prorocentrum_minimum.AAC.1